jgi:myosin V
MAHIYEVGTRAWQPDPTDGWVASEVKEKLVDGEKVQLVFELENGEVRSILLVYLTKRTLYIITFERQRR